MSTQVNFDRLLEPYHIGKVKTRNRMIKVAAGTGYFGPEDLQPGKMALDYYESIARGGVGLLTVEAPAIDNCPVPGMFRLDDDARILGLSELTEVIHKYGCPTFLQIYHRGPMAAPDEPLGDVTLVAASAVRIDSILDYHSIMPKELTVPEIKEFVNKFINAAERAKKAGFDGVEINAGSSHLLDTFLSRFWNRRQDMYGNQTIENRARIVVEIIQGMKKRLGQDFPVMVIMNGMEINVSGVDNEQGCTTIEDGKQIARILESAGADALHVRTDWIGNHIASWLPELLFYPEPFIPLKAFPREIDFSNNGTGAAVPVAAQIKQVVSIPVITVGKLEPVLGEKILKRGQADFIGLNRRIIADPELPNKVASGRWEDVAPCTYCCGCAQPGTPMQCRINTACGKEESNIIKPAQEKKKVLIVGGGPAGMEAARVAALRGHEVMIYDKSPRLGGSMSIATLVKGSSNENLQNLVRYFSRQMNKLGVRINLGKEIDPSLIRKLGPAVLILATGGVSSTIKLGGTGKGKLVSSANLRNTLKFYLRFFGPSILRWLTKFWMPLGKKVIIIGGNIQGCQLAEFLVERGRTVVIVDEADELAKDIIPAKKERLMLWLEKKGATMMTKVRYQEITDKGLIINTDGGKNQLLEADSILVALPLIPDNELPTALKGKISEIFSIGDCREPGLIKDAIADGASVSRKI